MSAPTVATPSRRAILSLYTAMLRSSRAFSSYNFRNYFLSKTRDTFRSIQAEKDPEKLSSMYAEAKQDLAVLRRSAIVNQLYGGWRLSVEAQQSERDPDTVKDRGDN
ncbi:hypothetical protein AMATHDRAFT_137494 [Amanita thiersii Skay4041]|uniref:Complex 1 LYR protein domain-containing protein n=1 Tax=Amanita thiersii Skay4041 TaxID=703135 RepID=A0A2A9NR58_9AGAR|nr:hypothetical protein AMATHDRAFT_137494 [Amanita thiersii Skay4041]